MSTLLYLWSKEIPSSIDRKDIIEELSLTLKEKGLNNVELRALCVDDPRIRNIISKAKYKVTHVPSLIVKDGKDMIITHKEAEISSFFNKIEI